MEGVNLQDLQAKQDKQRAQLQTLVQQLHEELGEYNFKNNFYEEDPELYSKVELEVYLTLGDIIRFDFQGERSYKNSTYKALWVWPAKNSDKKLESLLYSQSNFKNVEASFVADLKTRCVVFRREKKLNMFAEWLQIWIKAAEEHSKIVATNKELEAQGQTVEAEADTRAYDEFTRYVIDGKKDTWIKPKGHHDGGAAYSYCHDGINGVGWEGLKLQAQMGDMKEGQHAGQDMENTYKRTAHGRHLGMTKEEAYVKFVEQIEHYLNDPKLIRKPKGMAKGKGMSKEATHKPKGVTKEAAHKPMTKEAAQKPMSKEAIYKPVGTGAGVAKKKGKKTKK